MAEQIAALICYGGISVAGFCIAIHYWYFEIYKKRKRK